MPKKYKIIYDRDGCIGAGSCVPACPNNWSMNQDGKADCKELEITEEQLQANKEAAESCPVQVIRIEDEEGNQII